MHALVYTGTEQLEYMQYPEITEDDDLNYPRGSLLWEFGEEIASNSNLKKNHQIILTTMGTYKFYYYNNADIMDFIKA